MKSEGPPLTVTNYPVNGHNTPLNSHTKNAGNSAVSAYSGTFTDLIYDYL